MPVAWYRCPYSRLQPRPVVARQCAMESFTAEIRAAGGDWAESEIDGNQALVRVRGSNALLNSIGRVHPRLTDTEAQAAWTPTRARPTHDRAGDRIVFDVARRLDNTPLSIVENRVPAVAPSTELTSLIGSWLALGFGLGWRIPHWLAVVLALNLGEPTACSRQLIHAAFDQHGAFPTTGVLDNFTDTNGTSLPTHGGWANSDTLYGNCEIQGNAATAQAGATGMDHRSSGNFGPDSEVYETISTVPAVNEFLEIFCRVVGEGGFMTVDGYALEYQHTASGIVQYASVTDLVWTYLGASITQLMASGDAWGLEVIGSTLQAYRKPSGGSWGTMGTSRSNSTFTAAGKIAIWANNNVVRIDDFGGGTVAKSLVFRSTSAMQAILAR